MNQNSLEFQKGSKSISLLPHTSQEKQISIPPGSYCTLSHCGVGWSVRKNIVFQCSCFSAFFVSREKETRSDNVDSQPSKTPFRAKIAFSVILRGVQLCPIAFG